MLKDNYKHKIKEAKRESFRKFCSSPSSVSEMAGLVKAMASTPTFSALIANPTGDAPVTHEESHGNLLNHHFPLHTQAPPPHEATPPILEQQNEGELDWEDPVMALLTPP